MMYPDGGSSSGESLTSQVTLVVWLAQLVIDTLMGGRGGPEKRTTKISEGLFMKDVRQNLKEIITLSPYGHMPEQI